MSCDQCVHLSSGIVFNFQQPKCEIMLSLSVGNDIYFGCTYYYSALFIFDRRHRSNVDGRGILFNKHEM